MRRLNKIGHCKCEFTVKPREPLTNGCGIYNPANRGSLSSKEYGNPVLYIIIHFNHNISIIKGSG